MRKLFAPTLLRALVSRNVLVSVIALVVVVATAIYESNELIAGQFADESSLLASVALNEIQDTRDLTERAANLFASLQTTRELTEARDKDGLTNFLLPLKSRIGVDYIDVADNNGQIVASAQEQTGPTLQPELVTLAQAQGPAASGLFAGPHGPGVGASHGLFKDDP